MHEVQCNRDYRYCANTRQCRRISWRFAFILRIIINRNITITKKREILSTRRTVEYEHNVYNNTISQKCYRRTNSRYLFRHFMLEIIMTYFRLESKIENIKYAQRVPITNDIREKNCSSHNIVCLIRCARIYFRRRRAIIIYTTFVDFVGPVDHVRLSVNDVSSIRV